MKIKHEVNIEPESLTDLNYHKIVLDELSSQEYDKMLGLLHAIFLYTDFENREGLIKQTSLKSVSSSVLENFKK